MPHVHTFIDLDGVARVTADPALCDHCPAAGGPHTCHAGALCAYWFTADHDHPEDPGMCVHDSCCEIAMEGCTACLIETQAAYEAPVCLTHGAPIESHGSYSGYAGGTCSWIRYACGCSDNDDSADVRAAR